MKHYEYFDTIFERIGLGDIVPSTGETILKNPIDLLSYNRNDRYINYGRHGADSFCVPFMEHYTDQKISDLIDEKGCIDFILRIDFNKDDDTINAASIIEINNKEDRAAHDFDKDIELVFWNIMRDMNCDQCDNILYCRYHMVPYEPNYDDFGHFMVTSKAVTNGVYVESDRPTRVENDGSNIISAVMAKCTENELREYFALRQPIVIKYMTLDVLDKDFNIATHDSRYQIIKKGEQEQTLFNRSILISEWKRRYVDFCAEHPEPNTSIRFNIEWFSVDVGNYPYAET